MRTHLGPPVDLAYHRSFGIEGEKLKEAVRTHRAFNTENGVKMCVAYDGIPELVEELRKHGILVAVASLKPSETLARLIELQGITFDCVHGYSGNGESKSDLIKMCLTDLNINANDAVMVGDTEPDKIGAEGAGVSFIPVSYGYGFKNEGAKDVSDLKKMLLS